MNSRLRKALSVCALLSAGAIAATGCGGATEGDGEPARDWEPRARQVADAWDGSAAARAWQSGFHPLGDATELPARGLRAPDQRAYQAQNFTLRGALPADAHRSGRVTWAKGAPLTLPLKSAETAYRALDRNSGPGPTLTVTGAKLGTMTLPTSRGPATVPAWLFTVEGYSTPLKRIAVGPSPLPSSPIKPAASRSTSELRSLGQLVSVSDDGTSITVLAHHGGCDDGPVVEALETRTSVVLSAGIRGTQTGPCTAQLEGREVTVRLDRPADGKILLDAATGRPVPYGTPNSPSPSWS